VLSGVLLTLAVLGVVLVLLGLFCRAWLGSRGFIAERVRTELTQREAERQIQHIAYAAMQQMLDEARRHGGDASSGR
jgi:hypothetical protein